MIDEQYIRGWRDRIAREAEAQRRREEHLREQALSTVPVLTAAGARRVVLFGSVAEHTSHDGSDFDLAVEGVPPEALAAARRTLEASMGAQRFDLVRIEEAGAALKHAIACGEVLFGT